MYGYKFLWEPYKIPKFWIPDEVSIPLEVIADMPYFRDRWNLSVPPKLRTALHGVPAPSGIDALRAGAGVDSGTAPKFRPRVRILVSDPSLTRGRKLLSRTQIWVPEPSLGQGPRLWSRTQISITEPL